MITLEQVELLRSKADVTYEEARQALEAANGDLLDAVVLLEIQGKVKPPKAAGRNARDASADRTDGPAEAQGTGTPEAGRAGTAEKPNDGKCRRTGADSGFHKLWAWIKRVVYIGNHNHFVATRGTQTVLTLPITALVLLGICFFWAVLALVVIGMFTGFRYSFKGPDIHTDAANNIMNSAAEAAETLKRDVGTAINKDQAKNDAR
ncbi:MAG: DUF4342 domain-containing protein [Clostridia bacterium]|nr:DUF4342 domain-containing protein [Clostridia bacterium]